MTDIIIVGAGVQGLSTAHWLLKQGVEDFLVLEAGTAGVSGNTPRSAAMLVHQTAVAETTRLAMRSIAHYRVLQTQRDVGFTETGGLLFSTTTEGRDALRAQAESQRRLGLETVDLSRAEIAERFGHVLDADRVTYGIFCAAEGYIDPSKLLGSYVEDVGDRLRNDARVAAIERVGGRAVGVRLQDGTTLKCDAVVNAAGSRAKRLAATVGIDLPIRNSERCIVVIDRGDLVPGDHPLIEDREGEWYFRPHPDGVLFGLGPKRWVNDDASLDDPQFDEAQLELLAEYLRSTMPGFLPYEVVKTWSGYRPLLTVDEGAVDEFPILGPSALLPGYYNCCGAGAYGVTLGSACGELVAASITDPGGSVADQAAPFLSDRFEEPRAA